jgi:hypothetical protein
MITADDVAAIAKTVNWTNPRALVALRVKTSDRIKERESQGRSVVMERELQRQADALATLAELLVRETQDRLAADGRFMDRLCTGTGQLTQEDVLVPVTTARRTRYDALCLVWRHYVTVFEQTADLVQASLLDDTQPTPLPSDTQPNKVVDVGP